MKSQSQQNAKWLLSFLWSSGKLKQKEENKLSPCAYFFIYACFLTKVLYLLFFLDHGINNLFSTSSLDHLRVHSRARLSILLSNHIRCDTGHNKARGVSSFSLLMPLSWDRNSGHSVTLQGSICWGTRMQHRSQGNSGAWGAPAALLWGICSYPPGYKIQVCDHSTWRCCCWI